jgi:hypothetical protein
VFGYRHIRKDDASLGTVENAKEDDLMGISADISSPLKKARPSHGFRYPMMVLRTVDFPELR